jgi:CO/xanthine dehydrogenase FAD-binding subunit
MTQGNDQSKMPEVKKDVVYVRSKWEVVSYLNSEKAYKVMGGCTYEQDLPPASIIARTFPVTGSNSMADIRSIERHERYIDYGSAVTLSEILDEGKRRLSPVFYEAVESIATPFVRNMATIGGNVCLPPSVRGTLFPVLLAMKAKLRFQGENTETLVDIEKFDQVPQGSYLTKIRIPVEDWDIQLFRSLGGRGKPGKDKAVFVFLARVQRDTLSDLRIAYCRRSAFRSQELENQLIGMKLPIPQNKRATVLAFASQVSAPRPDPAAPKHSAIASPVAARQFLDLLELGLDQLS